MSPILAEQFIALSYMSSNAGVGGWGRGGGCGVSANGAQINFGDLTPYLNYSMLLIY